MPQITVIVPVFNGAKTLKRCIDSLQQQTLKDIEIIFVDDASTDGSQELLRQAAAGDPRVRLILHTENLTASISRNEGIRASKGEYILFVDGDDTLHLEACEELLAEMRRAPVDILQFGAEIVNVGGVTPERLEHNRRMLIPYMKQLKGREIFTGCFEKKLFSFTIWGKMYRGELCRQAVDQLQDTPMPKAQDLYLFWGIAWNAKSYRGVKKTYYRYYFGAGLSGVQAIAPASFRRIAQQSRVAAGIQAFMQEHDPEGHYTAIVKRQRDAMLGNCIWVLLRDVAPAYQPECFGILMEAWSPARVMAGLRAQLNMNLTKVLRASNNFSCIPRPAPRTVRRVGLYYYSIFNGGAQRVVALQTFLFTQMGYQVVLFTDQPPREGEYPAAEGVERVVLPYSSQDAEPDYTPRGDTWAKLLEEHPIDVMIYHPWLNNCLLWDMLMLHLSQVQVVVYTHSVAFYPFHARRDLAQAMPRMYSIAEGITALSRVDAKYWDQANGHTYWMHNPVDPDLLGRKPSTLKNRRILWIGRLSDEKCPMDAVEIMASVHAYLPDVQLCIVGQSTTGKAEKELAKRIEQLSLKNVVELAGFSKDVASYYRKSDVLLLTSEIEGYCMTLLEAKFFGVPCVSYDMPYLEMLRMPDSGVITVPKKETGMAAAALVRLLSNEEKLMEVGRQARKSAEVLAGQDLAGQWKHLLEDIQVPRPAPMETDQDEALLMDTLVDFTTIGPAPGKLTVQMVYETLPFLLRKVGLAWQIYKDLGLAHMLRYAIGRLKPKNEEAPLE